MLILNACGLQIRPSGLTFIDDMNMRFFYLLLVVVCCSCSKNESYSDLVVEVCNDELRNAISEYQKKVIEENKKEISDGDSIYIVVYFREMQDSIYRFVIQPLIHGDDISYSSILFKTTIDGRSVFFENMMGRELHWGVRKKAFFDHPKQSKWNFVKRYFPKETDTIGMKLYRIYEPEVCYLTFVKDSLIDKQMLHGNCGQKIKVVLNGKEVWL